MMDMQKNTDRSALEMELDELMNVSGGVPSLETQKRALMNDMRSAKASGKTFAECLDSIPAAKRSQNLLRPEMPWSASGSICKHAFLTGFTVVKSVFFCRNRTREKFCGPVAAASESTLVTPYPMDRAGRV